MRYHSVLTFIFLFSSYYIFGQFDYKIYSADDYTQDVASEASATWMATRGGLVRIDHVTHEVKHFNPTNSALQGIDVREVEIDDNNVKWVATRYGVYSYDDSTWSKVSLPATDANSLHIRNLKISDEGTVWFLVNHSYTNDTHTYLYALKNGILTDHGKDIPGEVVIFDLHSDSLMYAVTDKEEIYSFDGQSAILLQNFGGNNQRIYDLAIDKYQALIFALSTYDTAEPSTSYSIHRQVDTDSEILLTDTLRHYSHGGTLPGFKVDGNGDLWCEVGSHLLKIIEDQTEIHTYASLGIELPESDRIYFVGFDAKDRFILKDYSNSDMLRTLIVSDSEFYQYDTRQSQILGTLSFDKIGEDCNGNIYLFDYRGLAIFDGREWTNLTYETLGLDNPVNSTPAEVVLNPITCELWALLNFRSTQLIKLKDKNHSVEFYHYEFWDVVFDQDSTSYYMEEDSLLVKDFSGEEYRYQYPDEVRYLGNMQLGTNGETWFQGEGNIYRFKNRKWKEFNPDENPIAEHWGLDYTIDAEGRLWTYYEEGLSNWHQGEWELIPFDFQDALPNNMEFSNNGDLWLTTSRGIYIYDGDSFEHLNVYNAPLTTNYAYDLFHAKNDDVWVANTLGVTHLCSETSSTSNEAVKMKEQIFNIFPNPSSGLIHLTFNLEVTTPVAVTLRDINGRIVHRSSRPQLPATLEVKNPGMYLLTLSTDKVSETIKIVVTDN